MYWLYDVVCFYVYVYVTRNDDKVDNGQSIKIMPDLVRN